MTATVADDPDVAPRHAGFVLTSLILVAAVANLNLSVANVALPSIGQHFDSGQTTLDLIAVGYSLGLACSVLWFGALGDLGGAIMQSIFGALLTAGYASAASAALSASNSQVTDSVQNELTKSFSSAADLAQQHPAQASQIISAAKTAFLQGDQWAYLAGIIAVIAGGLLVFFAYPRHERERRLLAEYRDEATREAGSQAGGTVPRAA